MANLQKINFFFPNLSNQPRFFFGNFSDWNTVHAFGLNYREEATLSGSVIYMQALCFL